MIQNKPYTKRSVFSKSIACSLNDLVKPIFKKHGFAEHRILTEWEAIVGSELAACSVPQKLVCPKPAESGTLHILVASARALELQHMQPVIIDKIATYFGYKAVANIRLTQTSSDIFRKKLSAKSEEKQVVSESLTEADIECGDAELRNALLSLGKTMGKVKKKS